MNFLRKLFGRKRQETDATIVHVPTDAAATPDPRPAQVELPKSAAETNDQVGLPDPAEAIDPDKSNSEILREVASKLKTQNQPGAGAPGIWDMDGKASGPSTQELLARATPSSGGIADGAAGRKRRNKTRLLGFDSSDGDVVDLFKDGATEEVEAQAKPKMQRIKFPVGWILVIDGPGRGECFALSNGLSQIGRGDGQAVQLDFGDATISRTNHAAVVYDPEKRSFLLGHGGKSNIVRLNGTPVISNEPLADGDLIRLGETTLQLKTLCGPDFDWSETSTSDDDDGEDDDVAIA